MDHYRELLNSKSSLYNVHNKKLEKFNDLFEESNVSLVNFKNKATDYGNFFYLFRDVWLLLDSKMTLEVHEVPQQIDSEIRLLLLQQIEFYLKMKPLKPSAFLNAFTTFLYADTLVSNLIAFYETRAEYNYKLQSLMSYVYGDESMEQELYFSGHKNENEIMVVLTGELLEAFRGEYNNNQYTLYKRLDEALFTTVETIDTVQILCGTKEFQGMPFIEQRNIIEEVYNNQEIFEVVEMSQLIMKNVEEQLLKLIFEIDNNTLSTEDKPIFICPTYSLEMYKKRAYLNGIILSVLLIARKLKRSVYILPYSNTANNLYYFEEGEFTISDIIYLMRELSFGTHSLKHALNLTAVFIRENDLITKSHIVFITNEYFTDIGQRSGNDSWQSTFKEFKLQNKIVISCIFTEEKQECRELWFADQLLHIENDEKLDKVTIKKKNTLRNSNPKEYN